MKSISKFRPSPALVVAFIALFVAMSGVGYTAAKLNGKRLKNRSVTGKKLKRGAVTSTETNLKSVASKLPQVASAKSADSAKNATKAEDSNRLGNLTSSSYVKKSEQISVVAPLLDLPNVVAGSCAQSDVGLGPAGAQPGMPVVASAPTNFPGGLTYDTWIILPDQVRIRTCNPTASPFDPPSGSWRFIIFK